VHGAAQGYELILSSSTCSHTVAWLSARCADMLLRRFDTLFAVLIKQGSSFGVGNLHGLRYAAQDGLEGVQDAAPGGCHSTRATSSTHLPSWSSPHRPRPAPALLRQGAAGPGARVAWLGRKWSASACASCG